MSPRRDGSLTFLFAFWVIKIYIDWHETWVLGTAEGPDQRRYIFVGPITIDISPYDPAQWMSP